MFHESRHDVSTCCFNRFEYHWNKICFLPPTWNPGKREATSTDRKLQVVINKSGSKQIPPKKCLKPLDWILELYQDLPETVKVLVCVQDITLKRANPINIHETFPLALVYAPGAPDVLPAIETWKRQISSPVWDSNGREELLCMMHDLRMKNTF